MNGDVSVLMHDPDFAFPYTVIRTTGEWDKGRFEPSEPKRLKFYGPVQPATVEEIDQLPEGDILKGVVKFFCRNPRQLHLTRDLESEGADMGGISDEVEWRGYRYKIIQVMPWGHYGWMRAFGTMIGVVDSG